MNLNKLVIAIALATAAVGAHADTTYNLGALNAGKTFLAGSKLNNIFVDTGAFTDTFNFSLGSVSSTKTSAGTLNYSDFFVDNLTFSYSLFKSTDLVTALASGTNNIPFTLSSMTIGSYVLKVSGIATGDAGGLYSGALTVTPVPEPESYAMLLAGLGLMGTIARRRSKKE